MGAAPADDYYALLGIDAGADDRELRRAWRRLARGVARHAEGDVIELFLDEAEATEGGMVTISMRVPVRCPACATGATGATAPCAACGGTRTVDDLFSAWLAIRPGVADGTILHPSAQLPGMLRPVSFRVRLGGAPSR